MGSVNHKCRLTFCGYAVNILIWKQVSLVCVLVVVVVGWQQMITFLGNIGAGVYAFPGPAVAVISDHGDHKTLCCVILVPTGLEVVFKYNERVFLRCVDSVGSMDSCIGVLFLVDVG